MVYSCGLSLGGNRQNIDFPQKSFITSITGRKRLANEYKLYLFVAAIFSIIF